jgi:carbon monoxide dehydrogenase subunit G
MTTRVQRTLHVDAPPQDVWMYIADPGKRAEPITVIDSWEVHDDGSATWEVSLPIPVLDRTVTVETRDTERRAPEYVKFTGRCRVFNVSGEHSLRAADGGTELTSTFVVDGSVPGVERFFKRHLDSEIANLERELMRDTEGD